MFRTNASIVFAVIVGTLAAVRLATAADDASAGAGEEGAAAKRSTKTDDDRFTVPDGTSTDLVRYITKLITAPVPRDVATVKRLRKAILEAAEKVLADKPTDAERQFAVEAKMNMLDQPGQLSDFAAELQKGGHEELAREVRGFMLQIELRKLVIAGNPQVKGSIEKTLAFLDEVPLQPRDIALAYAVGMAAESSGDNALAKSTYGRLMKLFAASDDAKVANFARTLEGVLRRLNLVGEEMKIEGMVLGGDAFDWSKYRGRVVLVTFWGPQYPSCVREIANWKAYYELYHNKGLDIVSVSVDVNRGEMENFVRDQSVPWPIVVGDAGKPNPIAAYYGISNFPASILVGKDGKVVAINPYNEALRRELEKLLGPADGKKQPDGKSK
jgi:hypothetical protein